MVLHVFQQYKKLKRVKEQRLWTSILNGMEDQLWAAADTSQMEAAAGKQPYSIPAMINEQTNGLATASATLDGTTWTTKQGIAPATETRWAPKTVTYGSLAVATAGNVLTAFDDMFLSVKFDAPPTHQEYFEDPHMNAQFITSNKQGVNHYQFLLRESQDQFVVTGRQDPSFLTPKYGGIDVLYTAQLDTAAIYVGTVSGTPVAANSGPDNKGPRYYWINGNYCNPVYHSSRYLFKHPIMTHPNQPFTHVMPCDSWYNLVFRSLQRCGIVAPVGFDASAA